MSLIPLTLIINILYNHTQIFMNIKSYFTVYAEATGPTNTNTQSNGNVQGPSSTSNNSKNTQGNRNAQLIINSNVSNNHQIIVINRV